MIDAALIPIKTGVQKVVMQHPSNVTVRDGWILYSGEGWMLREHGKGKSSPKRYPPQGYLGVLKKLKSASPHAIIQFCKQWGILAVGMEEVAPCEVSWYIPGQHDLPENLLHVVFRERIELYHQYAKLVDALHWIIQLTEGNVSTDVADPKESAKHWSTICYLLAEEGLGGIWFEEMNGIGFSSTAWTSAKRFPSKSEFFKLFMDGKASRRQQRWLVCQLLQNWCEVVTHMREYGYFASYPRLRPTLNPIFGIPSMSENGGERWSYKSILARALFDLMIATTEKNAVCPVCKTVFIKKNKGLTCGDDNCREEYQKSQNKLRYDEKKHEWKSTRSRLKAPNG